VFGESIAGHAEALIDGDTALVRRAMVGAIEIISPRRLVNSFALATRGHIGQATGLVPATR